MPWAEARLDAGWQVAPAPADGSAPPADDAWLDAAVPGTVAGALRAAGLEDDGRDLDEEAWWFRCAFRAAPPAPGEEVLLALDGVATLAEVLLDGEPLLEVGSMWRAHVVDVGARLAASGSEEHVLEVRCRALGPELRRSRRPRARWRTRLVAQGLRFQRTLLLGRMPGVAPGPAAVGPWRPVRLLRRGGVGCEALRLRPRLAGDDGVLAVEATLRAAGDGALPPAVDVVLRGPSGEHAAVLAVAADGRARGELRVPDVARWWPHPHGEPVLHDVVLRAAGDELARRRVGFRTVAAGPTADHDVLRDGLDVHVNGVRCFLRGAVWTPVDPVGLAPGAAALRERLERVRAAGMDLLRVPGIGAYEEPAFHDLCDELGILVWQDVAVANLDVPFEDPEVRAQIDQELDALLDGLAGRPSTALLCGSSEVEQQVAMLGQDPALGRTALATELGPAALRRAEADLIWLPSAPTGGALPFRARAGVVNWFGVGAYRRPLTSVRSAEVRFASECLAFANVPDEGALPSAGADAWVPADAGADWDFRDVVDHYVADRYAVDPAALRTADPDRLLALERAVTGELMAEVLGEWRRAGSPCGGALVLWLGDLRPGAGWGLLDHRGRAKACLHHVARALAPVAVWTTDEGLDGIDAHVANDGPEALEAVLRVRLLRDDRPGAVVVDEGEQRLLVPPRTTVARDVEGVLGHFRDVSLAYGFGPPGHDLVDVALEAPDGAVLSRALRFPLGRRVTPEPAEALGAELVVEPGGAAVDGAVRCVVRARRALLGARVRAGDAWEADDGGFDVAPGADHVVVLRRAVESASWPGAELTALNLAGAVPARA